MFELVFLGGTFDEFHVGHKSLILRAFGVGEKVTIGLTSEQFIAKYKYGPHRSFAERKSALVAWLNENGLAGRTDIIAIDDPYEPAASGPYQALIATSANRIRAEEINAMRLQKDLAPLSIIEVPLITADDGLPISSTRVRTGEIDRTGHLIMPDILRTTLNKPFGVLHTGVDKRRAIISRKNRIVLTVGDVTAKSVLDEGIVPVLAVIDLQVRRKPYLQFEQMGFPPEIMKVEVASGPGYISQDARNAIKVWSENYDKVLKPTVIVVKGEEDLLTLPVIVAAPENSVIFYGQPPLKAEKLAGETSPLFATDEGLVEVVVNDEVRKRAGEILRRFQ
jgi:pantetheine-phosphate adenylyltransferase